MLPRLFRPRTDRMIAGVCGGLGLYFGIDPVIVRLLFVVLALLTNGLWVFLYPILWLVMPNEAPAQGLPPGARFDSETGQPLPQEPASTGQTIRLAMERQPGAMPEGGRKRILGLVLLGVGAMILLDRLGELIGYRVGEVVVPVLLVGLGIYLLRGVRA